MFEEQGILNSRCGERKKEQVDNTEGLHWGRAHVHQAARGLDRQIVGLLLSQNFAGSVGWKTKWAKELRILEKYSLERWTVKSLEEGKKVKPDRTCKFWGERGWLRDGVLDEVGKQRHGKNRSLWLESRL